jgi:hypothetical protein
MADEPGPVPGVPELETREGVLPDGTRMVLAVKKGLPQDEVDLLALKLWQEIPEE